MVFDWHTRRVLVTGATGFLGSWLCEALIERGAAITALVIEQDPESRFFSESIGTHCAIVKGDLAHLDDCKRAIAAQNSDIVFHLGAQTIVGEGLRDPYECFESNIRGTYSLLEAARNAGTPPDAFVTASSDKAYGESPVLPYTEDMALQGKHPYDVSKSCTDLLAQTYAHTYGLNVTVARSGNIYGGGDLNWSRIVPGTIRSVLAGQPPVLRSDGSMIRDYIYVKDVVNAYMTLAERSIQFGLAGQAYNFSPEKGYSVLEIVRAITLAMKSDLEPLIENTATSEIQNQTLNSEKAKRDLEWVPQWNLARGLTDTIDWYTRRLRPSGF